MEKIKLTCIKSFQSQFVAGDEYEYREFEVEGIDSRLFEVLLPNKENGVLFYSNYNNKYHYRLYIYDYFNLKQIERTKKIKEILK